MPSSITEEVYLGVSEHALNTVLVGVENGAQLLIYYVSGALLGTETHYTLMKKLVLVLIIAAQKLRTYFQGHLITIYNTYPMRNILHKPELSGG